MNKKTARRQRDLKSKLLAAVAMLLVSSMMMVTSTYAWFTLSTAPEVTGITTAVGANGNLEMALLPTNGGTTDNDIKSAVGDSMQGAGGAKPAKESNITWGNLVDLSTGYGLDKITLYPARLGATMDNGNKNPVTLNAAMLDTPQYGADGRISSLASNTTTGIYDGTAFYPKAESATEYGVRAVGVASGMTARQLAYRNSRSAAASATTQAKNAAAASLTANGNALASIAIKHGLGKGNDTYTLADVTALNKIIDDLLGTTDTQGNVTKTGILQYIDQAYIQYIVAYGASAAATALNDETFTTFKSTIESKATAKAAIDALATYGVTMPNELTAAIDKLEATKANVATAKTKLADLTTEPIEWGKLSAAMSTLADATAMKANGIPASEFTNQDKIDQFVNSVVGGKGITVTIASGGGVYADVADHCGDYSASITIKEVSYGTLNLTDTPATMNTASTQPTAYLTGVGTVVQNVGAPAGAATGAMPITDMYGYIVDLAFRTNAAESNLLLRQDAIDRIYGDNTLESTMGHGSTMTFKSEVAGFTDAKVKELMKSIRIVFFQKDGNKVLATAKLDMTEANLTQTAEGITAEMYIYTIATDGTEVKSTDNKITALTQNVATQVSVLVYLDGETITNADVAAVGTQSLVGTMNLQFASSANLTPMEYADLHQPAATTPSSSEATNPSESTGESTG